MYIFDSQDQVVRKIGSKGKGNGEFDKPAGLAFDDDNNLYVVCRYNHRVQKLTVDGEFLLKFGDMGTADGQLDCPLGITVHNKRVHMLLTSVITASQCSIVMVTSVKLLVNQEN